jgi:hypothetical protein
MERHEGASEAYEAAGLQILELAQSAYSSYVTKNPREQARLVKTVVSNSTFDRGSLSPTYIKPFDVFAHGGKTGDWLLRLDSPRARRESRGGRKTPGSHDRSEAREWLLRLDSNHAFAKATACRPATLRLTGGKRSGSLRLRPRAGRCWIARHRRQNRPIFDLRFVPALATVCCPLVHRKGKKRATFTHW